MKQIQIIRADGHISEVEEKLTLAAMQKIVGGYIERVTVLDRVEDGHRIYTSMYINEEGLLNNLPRNEKATVIYQRNIRTAFPDAENPFEAAEAEETAKYAGMPNFVVIDQRPADYKNDPYIVGDVIFFSGYSREEANEYFNTEENAA